MRTETINIYTYDELSEDAKKHAREQLHHVNIHHDWWDSVYDWFIEAAGVLGFTVSEKNINFSGFWSQGDGASFTGSWERPDESVVDIIKKMYPMETDLQEIAVAVTKIPVWIDDEWGDGGDQNSSDRIVRQHYGGCYVHENTVCAEQIQELTDTVVRPLCQWLYRKLEEDYEYLTSDEAVAEAIEENEYEFDEDGERYR